MVRLVLAFLAGWLTACSPGIGVYVGEHEPAALIDATECAVASWNAELGVDVFALVVSEHPRAGYAELGAVVVSTSATVDGGTNADTLTLGLVSHVRVRRGVLSEGFTPAFYHWLMMHEMGHALGLRHSDNPANVMYADPWEGEESLEVSAKQRRRARVAAALESSL